MRNTLINKFKIFAMLSAFVILFSSCDDSTSANKPILSLKDDISGNWRITRTCVLSNNGVAIGSKDILFANISKDSKYPEEITMTINDHPIKGYWADTELYKFKHWLLAVEGVDPESGLKLISLFEIGNINPLQGLNTNMYENPNTKELELINAFEFTGEKY